MVKAIYPGTFDPITYGHIDIVKRAARLFDHVVFAVVESGRKNSMFSAHERVTMAKDVLGGIAKIEVVPFNGLIVDFAQKQGAKVIVRGLRAVSDVDYELQMAAMNRQLMIGIETVFFTPEINLGFISSSLVREIAALKGEISSFVPETVIAALNAKSY